MFCGGGGGFAIFMNIHPNWPSQRPKNTVYTGISQFVQAFCLNFDSGRLLIICARDWLQQLSKTLPVHEKYQSADMRILLFDGFCPAFSPTWAASLHLSETFFILVFPSPFQHPLHFTCLTQKYFHVGMGLVCREAAWVQWGGTPLQNTNSPRNLSC